MAPNRDSFQDKKRRGSCLQDQTLFTISPLIGRQDEHSSVYIANEMAFAHNAMIRGINSIYNQAPYVHKAKDITVFLFLIKSWANWVGHHHNLEETLMFPSFEQIMGEPGFLQANVDQHHAFEPGLKKLEAFAIHTKVEDYKSDILRGVIDDFANGLQGHLNDEIPTLLAMRPYDSAALLKAYRKCEAVAGKQAKVEPTLLSNRCSQSLTETADGCAANGTRALRQNFPRRQQLARHALDRSLRCPLHLWAEACRILEVPALRCVGEAAAFGVAWGVGTTSRQRLIEDCRAGDETCWFFYRH